MPRFTRPFRASPWGVDARACEAVVVDRRVPRIACLTAAVARPAGAIAATCSTVKSFGSSSQSWARLPFSRPEPTGTFLSETIGAPLRRQLGEPPGPRVARPVLGSERRERIPVHNVTALPGIGRASESAAPPASRSWIRVRSVTDPLRPRLERPPVERAAAHDETPLPIGERKGGARVPKTVCG